MNERKYYVSTNMDEQTVQTDESSHARILRQVRPNSTVLECGPAYGNMTRYLKNYLHCTVHIIEYDPDSYAHTSQYADGGFCADLDSDEWLPRLEEGYYDFILYADVLEHLRDPQAVLTKMKRFLKPDGVVLLSVPNIANGDIIANLLCDQFTYTSVGLLDNTHIHFFARKNLKDMIEAAGFYLAYEGCIRLPLFSSEQGAFLPADRRSALLRALVSHPTAAVYQYICRLSQTKTETVSDVDAFLAEQNTTPELHAAHQEAQSAEGEPWVAMKEELNYYRELYALSIRDMESVKQQLAELQSEYDGMSQSFFWSITKPARKLLDGIKAFIRKHR